jgi:phospholipase/lecithinase/hemolysin
MVAAALLGLLFARGIHAAPINGLSIFGDSLSDPGNNAILLGSIAAPPYNVTLQSDITSNSFIPTYPYATSLQYSNGDVWAYQFAAMLGLPTEVAGPVLGGGLGANHAFGSATTGPLNNVGSVPSGSSCGMYQTWGSPPPSPQTVRLPLFSRRRSPKP